MRVRIERSVAGGYNYTTTWLPNGNMKALTEAEGSAWAKSLTNTQKGKDVNYVSKFEFTSDQLDRNTFGTWNPFEHFKREISPNPSGLKVQTVNGVNFGQNAFGRYYLGKIPVDSIGIPASYGTLSDPNNGSEGLWYQDTTGYHVSELPQIPVLCSSALQQILPGIRPKLLSTAELYQLKDFKSIGSTIKRAVNVVKFFDPRKDEIYSRLLRKLGPLRGTLSLSRWLAALPADVFLQWKFNIEPLLRDIADVHAALSDTSSKVAKLLAEEGKLLTRHYSAPLKGQLRNSLEGLSFEGDPQTIVSGDQFGDGTLGASLNVSLCQRRTVYLNPMFHAQVQYSYRFTDAQRTNAQLNGKLDALGLGVNPVKELWELIPWSFVVDWIVDIGHFLDNLENTRTKPVTVIHKWCWSQRIERLTTVTAKGGNNNGLPTDSFTVFDATLCRSTETSYKRGVTYCNIVAALTGSGIDSNEFVLALALTGSRKRSPFR